MLIGIDRYSHFIQIRIFEMFDKLGRNVINSKYILLFARLNPCHKDN